MIPSKTNPSIIIVVNTGLFIDVSASHIDPYPFREILLTRYNYHIPFLQPLQNLHDISVLNTKPDALFYRFTTYHNIDLCLFSLIKDGCYRNNQGSPGCTGVQQGLCK